MNKEDDASDISGSEDEDEEFTFHIENHRTHSEYMTLKQVNNFTQKSLFSTGIYMLDFDSEIFVWIGKDVPQDKVVQSFKHVGQAANGVHSKGKRRRDKIAFSITYQGFEPEVFKTAFASWDSSA